jgi:signal transduction histidine kinase
MRDWSLRGWLLVVSVLFAVLVVGGVLLTSYVIVSDGMQLVVSDTAERASVSVISVVREAVAAVEQSIDSSDVSRGDRARVATDQFVSMMPSALEHSGLSGAEFAIFGPDLEVLWATGPEAVHLTQQSARQRALTTGETTRSRLRAGGLISGLITEARLGINVVHSPVTLPGGGEGVLDVTYNPDTEEAVIDAIRLPMTILALSAMLIMVVLMQTSMVWVLNLVDDLRKAADSIDAGRLEERLPDSGENEIGDLARSLNNLIERLQRRADAQSRFVADASHELATPVAGIRGYTNILRAWGAEDPIVLDEAIDAIDRESGRMARLTSDLLNLLHADQGVRLKTERIDVNAIARERLAATASRYLDKFIEFEGPEDESLYMLGDPDRLEDVMSILLDNAGKYTPEGGTVAVRTYRRRDEITIVVSDTGRGIPPADLPRLFDRFFRSETARAEGEAGFGLGLAIAKSIVESMGGNISVESEVGEGTVFTIVVPRGRM